MNRLRLAAITALALVPETAFADALPNLNQAPDNMTLADVVNVLVSIIYFGLAFAAAIAMIFIVVSGYQYVMSAGNPEKVEKAKMGLTWAITGFIVSVSAFGIVLLFEETFGAKNKINNIQTPNGGTTKQLNLGGQGLGGQGAVSTLQTVIESLMIFGGAVAVLFLIIGGYRYITSGGNQQQTESARHTILYAVIGLAVVMLAATILILIQKTLRVS